MGSLDDMWHDAHRHNAVLHAPEQPVTRIPPTPVTARAIEGLAIAHAPGWVLVEWERWGEWHVRWMPAGQVKKL